MPALRVLHRKGVTANQITVSAILLSLLIGILFWYADNHALLFLALPIGLLLRMALNALDGLMARQYHQQSKLGEVLNEIGDVVSDLFVYFPLIKFQPSSGLLITIFLCLSILNEFAGILAKVISGQRRYEGPMGKSDRAFLVGLYGLLQFFCVDITSIASYLFIIINFLLLLSTYLRVKRSITHG